METTKVTCEAKDILNSRETKEYANIPSFIIKNIKSNQDVTAQARNLWFILYDKAKFDPELEIKVSIKWLVSEFGRSVRSIQRYISSLIEKGYLIVKNNFTNAGQTVNTYAVRVPTGVIEQSASEKDRKKPTKEAPPRQKCPGEGARNDIHNTINNNTISKQQTCDDQAELHNVEQKSDDVVCSFSDEKQKIELEITKIKADYNNAKDEFNKNPLDCEKLKHMTQLESAIDRKQQEIENIEKQAKKIRESKEKLNLALNSDGKRSLSQSIQKMVISKLKRLGKSDEELKRLLNEIAYESRFGSLVTNNQTKRENPVAKSVNIALKLVEEGRWSTPSGLNI